MDEEERFREQWMKDHPEFFKIGEEDRQRVLEKLAKKKLASWWHDE